MESMLLHYMLCAVNNSLNYGVKTLSDQLKLGKKQKLMNLYMKSEQI